MPTHQRQATSRELCARHAASELLRWDYPADAPADWNPTTQQVIDKTRALYPRVELTEAEARGAIAAAQDSRITA